MDCPSQMLVRLNCAPAACGTAPHSTITPFVIGGDISKEGAWPWAAVLQYNDLYQCSASLIDSQWVITAAHCVINVNNGFSLAPLPQYFTIRLGTIQRDGVTSKYNLRNNTNKYLTNSISHNTKHKTCIAKLFQRQGVYKAVCQLNLSQYETKYIF